MVLLLAFMQLTRDLFAIAKFLFSCVMVYILVRALAKFGPNATSRTVNIGNLTLNFVTMSACSTYIHFNDAHVAA